MADSEEKFSYIMKKYDEKLSGARDLWFAARHDGRVKDVIAAEEYISMVSEKKAKFRLKMDGVFGMLVCSLSRLLKIIFFVFRGRLRQIQSDRCVTFIPSVLLFYSNLSDFLQIAQ